MIETRNVLLLRGVFLFIVFYGLINILLNSIGRLFYLEFLGLLLLLSLTVGGFLGAGKVWGRSMFFFVFLFYIMDLMLLWLYVGDLYLSFFVVALSGFLISIPHKRKRKLKVKKKLKVETYGESHYGESHGVVLDVPSASRKKEERAEKVEKKVEVKYSPGKYVASSRSNIFHEPKCEWAKKIAKQRRTWFNSKEEAFEKGLKTHSCVN